MLKRGKHVVSVLVFIAVFVAIFLWVQNVFLPYWGGESDKYEVYYNLEENVIDIIFLGPSSNYFSVYPMELYVEHGIRSFNLGSPSQSLKVSYYQLLEACKTQKPKYCFIDMNSLFGMPGPEELHENQRYKMVVNMKPSKNKLDLIRASSETTEDVIEFLFPMYKFHTRWSELTALDFTGEDPAQEFRDAEYGATYGIGATPYLGYHQYCDPPEIVTTKEYEELFSGNTAEEGHYKLNTELDMGEAAYFDKMYTFCQENGITLVPIKTPAIASWGDKQHETAKEFVGQYGLPLVDMMYEPYKVEMDWSRDTLDGGIHCNILGGLKVTAFIGEWIEENCPDLQIGEDFASKPEWDSNAEKYARIKNDLLYIMESEGEKAANFFEETAGKLDNSLVVISVRNDMSTLWNEELNNSMRRLGLQEDFYEKRQQSYIAVIDRGQVVYEELSPSALIYRGTFQTANMHSLYVESKNFQQGDSCSIRIDGNEYAVNGEGINVVVYDVNSERVTDRVVVDVTKPGFAFSRA